MEPYRHTNNTITKKFSFCVKYFQGLLYIDEINLLLHIY